MNIWRQDEMNQNCLIAEEEETDIVEVYQCRMVLENKIKGLLPCFMQRVDTRLRICYDLSGKVSLEENCKNALIGYKLLRRFMKEVLCLNEILDCYLLELGCCIFQSNYIYMDDSRFYFCFYPFEKPDGAKEFHKLMEFMIERIDYEEESAVILGYELYQQTMKEHFCLKDIIPYLKKVQDVSRQPDNQNIYDIKEGGEQDTSFCQPQNKKSNKCVQGILLTGLFAAAVAILLWMKLYVVP